MNLKKLATCAIAGVMAASPVMAELVFPSLSYRTGPYAANGIPFADGYADYFTLLNERDGGIGGVPIRMVECETGYNTEKGVECYEATKGEGALVYQPLSTGITYQLIPKVTADGIPMHTMGYGRTSAKNGEIFNWVFNYPANYWDGASIAINHILDQEGGDISGKKIALVYHNSAYGKEPIRTLQELSAKHGYDLLEIAVDHPGQEQKSQWLQIRRERPDYVLMWGWGVMNQVAIQEAANIRFPMDKFIGIWWSGSENDVLPAGDGADGYKALKHAQPGHRLPALRGPAEIRLRRRQGRGCGRSGGHRALQPRPLRRDAGGRGGQEGAGDPRRDRHQPGADARRDGGAGDHRGEARRARPAGLHPAVHRLVREPRSVRHGRDPAVERRGGELDAGHRLHRSGPRDRSIRSIEEDSDRLRRRKRAIEARTCE